MVLHPLHNVHYGFACFSNNLIVWVNVHVHTENFSFQCIHSLSLIVHQSHAVFLSCICILCLCVSNAILNIGFLLCFHSHLQILVMAPKESKTIKTKAKRVSASSSKRAIVFDQTTFETVTKEQRFENVIQYRKIWPELEINLDELPLAIHRNLQCRNWLSLCKDL